MKEFYWATLILGLFLTIAMSNVSVVIPRTMIATTILLESPSDWTIALNTNISQKLSSYDVKNSVITAFERYRKSVSETTRRDTLWFVIIGLCTVVFSVIGLIREKNISKLKKQTNASKSC